MIGDDDGVEYEDDDNDNNDDDNDDDNDDSDVEYDYLLYPRCSSSLIIPYTTTNHTLHYQRYVSSTFRRF